MSVNTKPTTSQPNSQSLMEEDRTMGSLKNLSSATNCVEPRLCDCQYVAVVRTSKTGSNPKRRLFGCPNFRIGKGCDFFEWLDPPSQTLEEQRALRSLALMEELVREARESNERIKKLTEHISKSDRNTECLSDRDFKYNRKIECPIWDVILVIIFMVVVVGIVFGNCKGRSNGQTCLPK